MVSERARQTIERILERNKTDLESVEKIIQSTQETMALLTSFLAKESNLKMMAETTISNGSYQVLMGGLEMMRQYFIGKIQECELVLNGQDPSNFDNSSFIPAQWSPDKE